MEDLIAPLLAWKAAVIAAVFALLFVAERVRPMALVPAAARGWRRLARNGGLFLVNTGLSPLLVVPVSALAAAAGPDWRPGWWGGPAGLVLDLLILDLWIYGWHRLNHALPFLWRFHEVHHLDRHLDTTTAVRFHFGEVVLSAGVRALVILVLDIPLTSVIVFETVVLLASLFQHSNLAVAPGLERALRLLFVTPSHHWIHHHAVRCDTDSNYGNLLTLWDRLFGSYSRTPRTPTLPMGTEDRPERDLTGLLLRPLDPP